MLILSRTRWIKSKDKYGYLKRIPSCHVYIRCLFRLVFFWVWRMRCLLDEPTVSSTSKGIMDSTPVEGWWWQRWWVSSRFGETTSSHSQTMVNCWPILVVKFFFDTSSSDIIPFEMKVIERSGRLALPPTSTYCINQPVCSVICLDFPTIFPDLESCLVTVDPICARGHRERGTTRMISFDIITYYQIYADVGFQEANTAAGFCCWWSGIPTTIEFR